MLQDQTKPRRRRARIKRKKEIIITIENLDIKQENIDYLRRKFEL